MTIYSEYRYTVISKYRYTIISEYRNTEIPSYRNIEISPSRPQTKKPRDPCGRRGSLEKWRLPTLPRVCSTIGASGLNFSVRDGKRWDPAAITALNKYRESRPVAAVVPCGVTCMRKDRKATDSPKRTLSESIRAISTARL